MTTQFTTTNGVTYKVRINKTAKTAAISVAGRKSIIVRTVLNRDEFEYFVEGCPTANDWAVYFLRKAY